MDTNTLQQTEAPPRNLAVGAAELTAGELTDGQLLTAVVARKDKAAFEALVHRNSEMIFGVCHRLLGNVEDAADAFQAVFLVFVRKAASIRRPEVVRAWLYNTAVRTSLKARVTRQRRTAREKEINAMPEPALPESAGAVCELEGRSRKEVAGILRFAEGTLSSRLATARQKLAARLQRRGVAVPLAGLSLLLAPSTASTSMPATLTASTIEAATLYSAGQAATGLVSANAAALAQGTLKGMLLAKIKLAAVAVLVLGVLTAGLQVGLAPPPEGVFYYDFRGSKPVPDQLQLFGDNAETLIKPEERGRRVTSAWRAISSSRRLTN
jgi:DNA-directed RNA polymerase specialized sigma24 family protein